MLKARRSPRNVTEAFSLPAFKNEFTVHPRYKIILICKHNDFYNLNIILPSPLFSFIRVRNFKGVFS